ncbi:MAG: hypothetical protein NW214_14275 [Pseudanabaenaceae cyanobacterium bins.39]|nr:hypothetical protein [Pseudanabaenaceae cyanobacterium bins.39]
MSDPSPLQNMLNWVKSTPERAINDAFEAAVNIKRIEEENFNGNPIANDGSFGDSVFSIFAIQLQKNLKYIQEKLSFYRRVATLPYLQVQSDRDMSLSNQQADGSIARYSAMQQMNDPVGKGLLSAAQLSGNSRRFSIYQKLAFIDFTLERYRSLPTQTIDVVVGNPSRVKNERASSYLDNEIDNQVEDKFQLFKSDRPKSYRQNQQSVTPVEKSILPGSFFKAFDRVKRNLSGSYSEYEKDIVEELRQSRQRINQALRYIVILIVVVIATQLLTRYLIFSPMIDSFIDTNKMTVRFSPAIEERAFQELKLAKERIEFNQTIRSIMLSESGQGSPKEGEATKTESKVESKAELQSKEPAKVNQEAKPSTVSSEEDVEELIRKESLRIMKKYNEESLSGVKNLLADISAAFVFYLFLLSGRQELNTIKEFLDEILYSLNDNAKAFLIIISTDTFVGFHSSEGWDALLTVIFQHFGLPENKILAQSFISTVPVFLDGLFKFWIFQYLTQASPATATIYREMNE